MVANDNDGDIFLSTDALIEITEKSECVPLDISQLRH